METAPQDRQFDLNKKKSGWECPRPVRLRRVKEFALVGCGLWGAVVRARRPCGDLDEEDSLIVARRAPPVVALLALVSFLTA